MDDMRQYIQRQFRKHGKGLLYTGVSVVISVCILPHAWAVEYSPTMLNFQAVQGGTIPASQVVTVSQNANNNVLWTSNDTAMWVNVMPTMGMMTGSTQVSVSVNPAGLGAGTYTAAITITTGQGRASSLPVTLTVMPAGRNGTAGLSWSPSISSEIAGYKVYVGTTSNTYGAPVSVGKVTSFTVTGLEVGKTYYFRVKAYNASGIESGFSNEVSKGIY